MRSLKAITKKSWLITLSIRTWSHRQFCAVKCRSQRLVLNTQCLLSVWLVKFNNRISEGRVKSDVGKLVQSHCLVLQRTERWASPA